MENVKQFVFEGIGSKWVIDISIDSYFDVETAIQEVKDRVELFDKTYSRFRKDSWVYMLFKNPGTHKIPADFIPLYEVYEALYSPTDNLFTPTIGNLMREAGYDEDYTLIPKKTYVPPELKSSVLIEKDSITVHSPVMLDFGAAGKGYIIDLCSNILKKYSPVYFCIDVGGDILQYSQENKEIIVGLENPANTQQVLGTIKIANQSICGSAGNRRKWNGFHHIINPKTKNSPKDVIATWVVAKDALHSDAMATALFLAPKESVAKTFPCEYMILFKDFSVKKSNGFEAELFVNLSGV